MKRTILNPVHRALQGRMVEFGGFEMPVQYRSIVEEHRAVRSGAGLFDLCHMGRFEITGDRAVEAVNRVITNDVAAMKVGQIRYALVLNEEGGVRDDILVYRMPESVLLVVNAGNRDKLLEWFGDRLAGPGIEFRDRSEELAMIAVQGPRSEDLLAPHTATLGCPRLAELGYYRIAAARITIESQEFIGHVSRTGYTGEDGFEIYVPSPRAEDLWERLLEVSGTALRPCGLGARDTLRLEAGMPLYGHELDEETNPLEAGLGFAVKLKKPAGFIGREALQRVQAEGPRRRLRGFRLETRRVAREGMPVLHDGEPVGHVTSGAPSPTLGFPIAMAYVEATVPAEAPLEVDLRGTRLPLKPHPIPFYKRP